MAVIGLSVVGHTSPVSHFWLVAAGAAPVMLVVTAGVLLGDRAPETAFLALAAAAGLPHGALDHAVGRRAFGFRYGEAWWRPFLFGYLALVSATLLLWWTLPSVALLLFLGLSLFHFGDEDATPIAPVRTMRVVAHGGAVIIVPAAFHSAVVEHLFAVLAPGHASIIQALLSGPLMVLWTAATIGTLAIYAASEKTADRAAAIDLVLVSLLFGLATPLIAFSLYFAAIHTLRALAASLPNYRQAAGAMRLPIILTALGLALGGVIFIGGDNLSVSDNIVRSTFLLLSALTVPHMWLAWRSRLAEADGRAKNRTTDVTTVAAKREPALRTAARPSF